MRSNCKRRDMDFHRIKNVLQTNHTLPAHEWKGAVLFLCNEERVFFIKRSEFMPTHGGQVAFVGGHKKPDETYPWDVALREFTEETSLGPEHLEFIGFLPAILTTHLLPIIPVVAKLNLGASEFLDRAHSNGEWDSIFSYPWAHLTIEDNWNYAWRNGFSRRPVFFHTIKAQTFDSPHGNTHPHLLWGATASMVWDFLRLYFKG
jgi:8-oxo-dGTP pyrophosphatase MutT (NUDIX family)